jgi:hypothetical protein
MRRRRRRRRTVRTCRRSCEARSRPRKAAPRSSSRALARFGAHNFYPWTPLALNTFVNPHCAVIVRLWQLFLPQDGAVELLHPAGQTAFQGSIVIVVTVTVVVRF